MKELEDCLREALEESPYGIVTNDTALETARKYASELLRQRDELREKYSKLLDATSELLRSMKTDNVELKKSINEMAKNMAAEIAAIKNTEG
jgi:hypothetical protein